MDENGFFAVEDGTKAVAFSLASDRQSVESLIAAANRAEALQESAESLASKVKRLLNWREDKSPYTREYCEDKVRQAIQHLELVVKEQLPLPAAPKEVQS
jgi:hypothetical protein